MITHEQHVADTARRVIRLSDGMVVEDVRRGRAVAVGAPRGVPA
jgi:hypothetical protein